MPASTFLLEPFDLVLYSDPAAASALQGRFAAFLRGLDGPARFVTWHRPASLSPLVDWTLAAARHAEPERAAVLMEYRRWYERLEGRGGFQQALCGAATWSDDEAAGRAFGLAAGGLTNSPALRAPWPPLMGGRYRIKPGPIWHLAPVGRPAGRPLLGSYAFRSVEWTFSRPLLAPLLLGYPVALAVDVPRTWAAHESVSRIEGVMSAMQAHLATSRMIDSASQRQLADCSAALSELHSGQALHDVSVKFAVAADDPDQLRERAAEIKRRMEPYISLRVEVGLGQARAARYFSAEPTSRIDPAPSTWPMTSPALALGIGFLGLRKQAPRPGIVRGAAVGGGWPYITDDWDLSAGKKALHEVWVGTTGSGKTFALNCYLSRSLAHYGVPFDLLEPMGHGRLLASAFGIEAFTLSTRQTSLNPHDPVYTRPGEQISHVLRLYETILGRPLGGTPSANLQASLLSQALSRHYAGFDLAHMGPEQAPLLEDVMDTLSGLGETDRLKEIARELAEEIAGLATGSGPYSHFLNARTSVDFSAAGAARPRIFCFDGMEDDPVLTALAYTQVLAALLRSALADESPRIIAVDEVYRMMRHPSLLPFLVNAVKTLRTRRKKVIVIDQQLRVFLSDPGARLLFENCPTRVIFAQRGGEDIIAGDPAFGHYSAAHRQILGELPRFRFLMETDEGIYYLDSVASPDELRRFGGS